MARIASDAAGQPPTANFFLPREGTEPQASQAKTGAKNQSKKQISIMSP
jgi:hypothetical protein